MSPQMVERLWDAFLDTLAMVGASVAIAVALGVPLAVFLVLGRSDDLRNGDSQRDANQIQR